MRPDQYERLKKLSEDLTDVFLNEADPTGWDGYGMLPKDQTKEDSGNAYWSKKNAVATIAIVIRVGTLIDATESNRRPSAGEVSEDDRLLDAEIAEAEAAGRKALNEILKKQDQKNFVKRAVGKHG